MTGVVVDRVAAWQHSAVEATSVAGVRSHTAWSVIDQVVSSASNAVLPLVALALLRPEDAGRLSVLLSMVFFALGVCRSLLGETFLLSARPVGGGDDHVNREMLGAALILGLLCGVPIAAAAVVLLHAGWSTVPLALGFGAVVLQDTARYAFFAQIQARRAVVSDVTWLIVFVATVLVLRSRATPASLMVGWILAGSIAGGVGAWQLRAVPAVRATTAVLRRLARLGAKIGAEYIAVSGLPQALIAIVGLSGSLAAAGPYRLATTLLTPAGVVVTGVITALQPVCVRFSDQPVRLRSYFLRAAALGSLAVTGCAALVLAVPPSWGRRPFGDAYHAARLLCIPLGLAGMAQSASAAANLVVRARGRVMDAVRVRFGFGLVCLAVSVPAAHRWGGTGVAWLYAACSVTAFGGLLLSPALRFRVSAR